MRIGIDGISETGEERIEKIDAAVMCRPSAIECALRTCVCELRVYCVYVYVCVCVCVRVCVSKCVCACV